MAIYCFLFGLTMWYAIIWLITNKLAFYLTEVRRPLFDVKPFNCWGCTAFWFNFITGSAVAYTVAALVTIIKGNEAVILGYLLGLVSFLSGLINYFYIQSKIKIYE